MATCGEALVGLLAQYGVECIFGIPGVHTVELYRGVAASGLRHITPRHEQGAGFAADGYARVSGKPGVCFIITGPGMTNIVTAMAQALADSIPMLVISSVNARHQLGRGSGHLHELPSQQKLVAGVSVFSHTLMSPDALPEVLARAFAVFASARPGPVHIEIPLDVIVAPADHLQLAMAALPLRPAAAPAQVQQAAQLLASAQRPLILVGGGALDAAQPLWALAQALQAPVQLTINAKGLLLPTEPLLCGSIQSTQAGRLLARQADVVLAVGTELGETDYDAVFDGGFALPGRLVRIDIDPAQLARNYRCEIGIVADAAQALGALVDALPTCVPTPGWGAARAQAAWTDAQAEFDAPTRSLTALITLVDQALPGAIFVGDSTQTVYVGNLSFNPLGLRRWFNASTGYGTLGYGLPAANGAQLAAPGTPVVALVGDGGLLFTLSELATAVEAQLPVVVLLWNNQGYGEIKKFMLRTGVAPIGVDLATPDFVAIAQGFGCHTDTVANPAQLRAALARTPGRDRPTLVHIDEATWFQATA
ncbi:5-guanidino-2-oxopentanoate decarboxylase [Rhodoferax sp.]|uniref:5-guanidino-2-oxopentanoate decarboxylase n=1 Tax=Rhodoferax sp. TaxID=50421 RepID=UPI00260028C0|nr:5-guanidino-2-oxopentanoate decarboxylase [Rhodoferax sp.]